jgi:hypothetical protein
MITRHTLAAILAAVLMLAAAPVRATDNHEYARGEYAIIRDGLAPDRKTSLAAHGEGEFGIGNFHVWLMAGPAHRRIAPLQKIESDNTLDTGPMAYQAAWSKDSRRVAVTFRSNRHVVELNLYRIENRRAQLISGPSLFREVAGRDVDPQEDMRLSVPEIAWQGPDRFRLREHRLFMTSDDGFAGLLGSYGKVTDRFDDGRMAVEFSAEADGVLIPGNRYRILDLRPFTDPAKAAGFKQ